MFEGSQFQVVDTMELECRVNDGTGKKRTIATIETSKTGLDQKTTKIEVRSGIGEVKRFELDTKKDLELDANIKAFDLEFFALKNGVSIDKTSKATYYMGQPVAVTTKAATIAKAKRLFSVKTEKGVYIEMVDADPASVNEVKVTITPNTGATLTFHADFVDTSVLVSYEGEVATGKDNYTVHMYADAFPSYCEILGRTVVYDEEQAQVVGDIYVDLYKAKPDANFQLSLEMGKPVEIPVKFTVLCPSKLPDGTLNTKKELGKMVMTER